MDAAEDDRDIKLQKLSSTFIADFDVSLHSFLYRTAADGTAKVRRNVRAREADRLVGLVIFLIFPLIIPCQLTRPVA